MLQYEATDPSDPSWARGFSVREGAELIVPPPPERGEKRWDSTNDFCGKLHRAARRS